MSLRFDTARARFAAVLARLDEALAQPEDAFVRDAVIQRFEFTFELGWKAIQAYLHTQGTLAGAPRQAIREGASVGVLDDSAVEAWLAMLDARNLTSHTYREEMAVEIAEEIRARHAATLAALAGVLSTLDPDAP